MRRAWIALTMLMVACGARADSQPPFPGKSSHEPKQTESEANKTDELGHSVQSIYVETPVQKSETEKKPPSDWWSIVLSGCLLVVAFFQLLTYRRQASLMEKQASISADQKGIMQSSLEATQKAANAAELSAKAAIGVELPKLVLVHLDFAIVKGNLAAKIQHPAMNANMKNFGRTPAFITSHCVEVFYGENLPHEPDYQRATVGVPPDTVIESGQLYEIHGIYPLYRPVPLEKVEAIEKGELSLWVYGFVRYRDFLGESHESKFCKTFIRIITAKPDERHIFVECENNEKYIESY